MTIKEFLKPSFLITLLAELLLFFIILPIMAIIFEKLGIAVGVISFLLNLLGTVDIFDIISNVFAVAADSADMNFADLVSNTIAAGTKLETTLFELFAIAICVELLKKAAQFIGYGGVLLPSTLGVFFGVLIAGVYETPILVSCFLFLLTFVIDLIFFHGFTFNPIALILEYLKFALKTSISMLSVVFAVGFFVVLIMMLNGTLSAFGLIVYLICACAVPWLLLQLITKLFA